MSIPSKRILLVEDNADNRLLTTLLFEGNGFEVVSAVSGADGIDAARQSDFALVLLDLQLPDIDGFEVARRLREHYSAEKLPIIAVSAFALPQDRRRAFAAGCTGYLEKPIDPDAFVGQVRCMMGTESVV